MSYANIEAHYEHSNRHAYCARCRRHFTSWSALDAHWENSSVHNICIRCNFDGLDHNELKDHCYKTGCAIPCESCDFIAPSKNALLKNHLRPVFGCHKCHKHCDNHNNLRQHILTHQPANIECWGCERRFVSFSQMILHLESGMCESGCTQRNLNSFIPCVWNLLEYTNREYRKDLVHCVDIEQVYGMDARPFCCATCDSEFRLLSGLLQHAESGKCSEDIAETDFSGVRELFEDEYV